MFLSTVTGLLLPFAGTTLGAATVFFTKNHSKKTQGGYLYCASAGVMMAASVWSLIIPSVNMSQHLGFFSFVPAFSGLWLGAIFLILSEKLLSGANCQKKSGNFFLCLAVILHNIPEGMAVGVCFAGALAEHPSSSLAAALLLSLGIALQNIPEGAIISLPEKNSGVSKKKAFLSGTLSGVVEPVFALLSLVFSSFITSLMPYLLGFAAGTMIYVSVYELMPKSNGTKDSLCFILGFCIMMMLDIALG